MYIYNTHCTVHQHFSDRVILRTYSLSWAITWIGFGAKQNVAVLYTHVLVVHMYIYNKENFNSYMYMYMYMTARSH